MGWWWQGGGEEVGEGGGWRLLHCNNNNNNNNNNNYEEKWREKKTFHFSFTDWRTDRTLLEPCSKTLQIEARRGRWCGDGAVGGGGWEGGCEGVEKVWSTEKGSTASWYTLYLWEVFSFPETTPVQTRHAVSGPSCLCVHCTHLELDRVG